MYSYRNAVLAFALLMDGITKVSIDFAVASPEHARAVAASMARVADLCRLIAARKPQGWYGIGRAIADAEAAVPECNFAEVEFAAYLAGLAVPGDET